MTDREKKKEKPYVMEWRTSSGKKDCLLCDGRIPPGNRILHLTMTIRVVITVTKEEEIHPDCARGFARSIDGLLEDCS